MILNFYFTSIWKITRKYNYCSLLNLRRNCTSRVYSQITFYFHLMKSASRKPGDNSDFQWSDWVYISKELQWNWKTSSMRLLCIPVRQLLASSLTLKWHSSILQKKKQTYICPLRKFFLFVGCNLLTYSNYSKQRETSGYNKILLGNFDIHSSELSLFLFNVLQEIFCFYNIITSLNYWKFLGGIKLRKSILNSFNLHEFL